LVARHRRGLTTIVLAVAMTAGPVGTADAVTVGVRGIFNGSRFVWSPAVKGINTGVTVRWRSVDGSHTVKSRGTNWSYFRNVPAGTSVTRTFNRRGTFRYYCTIHGSVVNGVCSGMCGRIVVS
jgi:plastocyanin